MAKRYRLQDPIKFITFLLAVAAFVILLILLIRSCGSGRKQAPPSGDQSSSSQASVPAYEPAADLNGQTPEAYAARQNISFTASLVSMIYDVEKARTTEEQVKEVPILYTIVVDPGCGGTENGNPGIGGVWEKEINLNVALALRSQLNEEHPEIRVILTRTSDRTLTGQDRIDLINETKPDLAISLHCDYFAGASERRGATSFCRNTDGSKIQLKDGKKITVQEASRQIASELQSKVVSALETENRGVSEARYDILNKTNMPAVLIEMVYLTDQSDYDKITSTGYVKAFAEEMTDGIYSALTALYPDRQPVLEGQAEQSAVGSSTESGAESSLAEETSDEMLEEESVEESGEE